MGHPLPTSTTLLPENAEAGTIVGGPAAETDMEEVPVEPETAEVVFQGSSTDLSKAAAEVKAKARPQAPPI